MRAYSQLFAIVVLACLTVAAQDLASTEPKTRAKAAKALAKNGSESIPQLTPLLKDPVIDVRREAVRSIVTIGSQYSLDPLVAATKDNDPEVQLLAVDGLVNYYVPGYVGSGFQRLTSAVKARFDRENTDVVDAYLTVRPEVIQAIGPLITAGAAIEVRASAARAIGILRGKTALPMLLDALKAKDDTVIFESLIAIQKIRDESAGPRVIFLMRDLQERVQVAAIETAGLLKTKDAVPDLTTVYNGAKADRVRRSALGSLAMIASPASRQLFEAGLNDRSEGVRASAAEGLARLKLPASKPAVEQAFNTERKMAPRLAAAFALVALGQNAVGELSPLTYLVNTLNSKSYRDVARPYLVELSRDPGVRQSVSAFLRQGTKDEKIGLARVLAVSGDRTSVELLNGLTKDPDPEVAQEAITALKNLQARLG